MSLRLSLSLLLSGVAGSELARARWVIVPIATARHRQSPRSVMPGPQPRHGGTMWHGTTVSPCPAVPCSAMPCSAVPVPVSCRAARLASYTRHGPSGPSCSCLGRAPRTFSLVLLLIGQAPGVLFRPRILLSLMMLRSFFPKVSAGCV